MSLSDSKPTPFTVDIPEEVLKDLQLRLSLTRFPDQGPEDVAWQAGTNVAFMKDLVNYWQSGYDWRKQEAELNKFPQFKMHVAGIDLHFIHAKGANRPSGSPSRPLLLMHGWPGSIVEFLELIPMLTAPENAEDAFDVVAPSLPGYAFSYQPGFPHFGAENMADAFVELMSKLGYEKFAVQGGDWGGSIAAVLGSKHADRVVGICVNLLAALKRDPVGVAAAATTEEEKKYAEGLAKFAKEGSGYAVIQGSKPQTLAFGLTDSPAGLAAWIAEKFFEWTDHPGTDVLQAVSKDRLLTNIMLYWCTGAIRSSFSPYYVRHNRGWPLPDGATVTAPTSYVQFPKEILLPPRSIAEKVYTNIQRWTEMQAGGHFAALEQPRTLATEVQEFFRGRI